MTMDVSRIIRDRVSRRRFFEASGVTFVGGSAVFLGACGDDEEEADGGPESDVRILNGAIQLENTAIVAYTKGAALLNGAVLAAAKQFRDQEIEHADGLAKAVQQLGGKPTKQTMQLDFSGLKSQKDVLELATSVENVAIATYVEAIPKLSTPELRAVAAQILTNEAEHVSVLLGALGRPPVPDAFVTGNPNALS
jgi:rubrerythrin